MKANSTNPLIVLNKLPDFHMDPKHGSSTVCKCLRRILTALKLSINDSALVKIDKSKYLRSQQKHLSRTLSNMRSLKLEEEQEPFHPSSEALSN